MSAAESRNSNPRLAVCYLLLFSGTGFWTVLVVSNENFVRFLTGLLPPWVWLPKYWNITVPLLFYDETGANWTKPTLRYQCEPSPRQIHVLEKSVFSDHIGFQPSRARRDHIVGWSYSRSYCIVSKSWNFGPRDHIPIILVGDHILGRSLYRQSPLKWSIIIEGFTKHNREKIIRDHFGRSFCFFSFFFRSGAIILAIILFFIFFAQPRSLKF